jgi:DNA-binding transcriptional regulator YhcF (GntR family)
MTMRSSDLLDFIGRRSPALALHMNEPLVNFMVVARKLCGDDLDAVLVMLVIVQRANRHPAFARLEPEEMHRTPPDELPSLRTNVRSIADSTGIPRETVRRKVQALSQRGLVEVKDRMVRFTPEGYCAVEPAREALVKLMARVYRSVDAELAKAVAEAEA